MKKKVCIIGDLYQTFTGKNQGGGESQLVYAAKALNRLGFFVVIVDYRIENRTITKEGIEFIPLNKNKKISILDRITKRCLILYRLLIKIKADYIFTSMRSFQHIIPIIVAKKQRAKFYYWVAADIDLENFISKIRYEIENKQLKKNLISILLTALLFPLIINNSDKVFVQHNNQLKKIKNPHAFILSNVVETINLKMCKSDYLIWVGSIDFKKGFHILEKLINDLKDIKLKIIGKIRAPECTQILKKITQNSNIEYLGNLEKNDDVLLFIGKARALINTSFKEGFPITFIEAWSLNTYVISLHVDPGNVINDKKLGFCAHGDYREFVNYVNNFNIRSDDKLRKYYELNHSYKRFHNELKLYFND